MQFIGMFLNSKIVRQCVQNIFCSSKNPSKHVELGRKMSDEVIREIFKVYKTSIPMKLINLYNQ